MMSSSHPSRLARVAARFTSPSDVWLGARIMAWACALPILKQILPIRPLVKLVWRRPRLAPDLAALDATLDFHHGLLAREEQVVTFARWACRLTRWKSGGNCLERGLIAYRFLLESGAAPTLMIGVARGARTEIIGHAWVLLNGTPAGESAALVSEFVPALVFGPGGDLIRSATATEASDLSPTVR